MPRLGLATLPTPLQETPRLAAALGLDHLLLKRDDNTGLALGGNKARKLEYLVADAARAGADMLLTLGAPQSNHCRMTAAAARVAGMDSHFVFAGPSIDEVQANMLLDRFFGATWTFAGDQPTTERMAWVAQELRARGRRPYVIPGGGSNGLGALGYVGCAFELAQQLGDRGERPRYIVCAGGSCGTESVRRWSASASRARCPTASRGFGRSWRSRASTSTFHCPMRRPRCGAITSGPVTASRQSCRRGRSRRSRSARASSSTPYTRRRHSAD